MRWGGWDTCRAPADSCWCVAEANSICKANILQLKINFNKRNDKRENYEQVMGSKLKGISTIKNKIIY